MAVFVGLIANGVGVGAAFSATAVGGFFTSTILGRLLGSVALSLLQASLVAKPPTPGITTEFTGNGGVNPCAFILGKYATAGDNICPPMTHGKVNKTPNAYLTYVIELGDIAGQTLSRVLIDGAYEAFTGAVHADYGTAAVGRLAGYAWLKYYDGTQTAADPGLLAKYGSYPERPWLSDMVGTGICYAILTFRYNRELYQAYPQCRFEMGGIKLYDPRADSSVGGSGGQRWATPSSWAASVNPMVMAYNTLRGITLPGLGVWGGDADADDLPLASLFAGMNACDVLTPRSTGLPEPTYRAGYEVTVDMEPAAVIEELLKACAGQMAEVGGQWKVRVGGAGLPVYFMTDADVIVSKPQDYDPFPSSDRRMNGIDAQYPDPTEGWEPKAAPARYNATWEAEDGGKRRVASLDLPACPYPNQVQRIMTGYIADERRFRRHNMTLPPDAAILEPLDAIAWTSARNGYVVKLFDVAEMVDDVRRMNQGVAMREVDATDFDWSTGLELPVAYASSAVAAIPVQTVEGFDLFADTVTDDAGTGRRSRLRLVWNGAEQDGVTALEYEVRVAATALLIKRGTITDVAAGEMFVADGILPATTYQARARPVVSGPAAWTGWESATTALILLGGVDIADDAIGTTKLATILQSDSYSPGVDGWQIKRDGNAEFNGVVLSRQIEVDTGYFTLPALIGDTNATTKHLVGSYWIETTIDSSAWTGVRETYLALVGKRAGSGYGSVFATSGNIASYPSLIQWGWGGEVVPITRWSGSPRLWIRAELWTQRVDRLEDFVLEWRLMKVT